MQKTVASIFFQKLECHRNLFGFHAEIPAVEKGAPPFLLKVPDCTQWEQNLVSLGGQKVPRAILGESIADDVVNEICRLGRGMSPECCPGLWIVRDQIQTGLEDRPGADGSLVPTPVFRPVTAEEARALFAEDLALAEDKQARYGEWLIEEARRLFRGTTDGENPRWIDERMRLAGQYYGIEEDWVHRMGHGDTKKCPACTKPISRYAWKCPHCAEIIDNQKYAQHVREQREILAGLGVDNDESQLTPAGKGPSKKK